MKIFIIFITMFSLTFADNLSKDSLKTNKIENTSPIVIKQKAGILNLKEIFFSSPVIYSILFLMSIASFVILLFTILTFKKKDLISNKTIEDLKNLLLKENFEKALSYCEGKKDLLSVMIASGICTRHHGAQHMINTLKSEGKRATSHFWQKISILNDIVVIAPMFGLLGTVIGMFYAFYDVNRSIDSISALFDGLGIAVGTTVAGLIVAILSMIFHATLKFRMLKTFNVIENEAVALGNLIKTKE